MADSTLNGGGAAPDDFDIATSEAPRDIEAPEMASVDRKAASLSSAGIDAKLVAECAAQAADDKKAKGSRCSTSRRCRTCATTS